MRRTLLVLLGLTLVLVACGGDSSSDDAAPADAPGLRLVSPDEGEVIRADPPEGLVVLDVRTPEEFAEGHLEDAVMLDFYEEDFAAQLAELDPDAPYLLYCRSGNRSGQTVELMRELGFTDVADVDGGILAWDEAGLPIVTD
ncbi:MAG: rhodanese-like domain-containing protein [Actinomycetota bacterium]